jgi:hypothetical protein
MRLPIEEGLHLESQLFVDCQRTPETVALAGGVRRLCCCRTRRGGAALEFGPLACQLQLTSERDLIATQLTFSVNGFEDWPAVLVTVRLTA